MCLIPPRPSEVLLPLSSVQSPQSASRQSPDPPTIVVTDHIRWARAVARGVRREFQFLQCSQEEKDLESVAYLALVELARRFDPAKAPAGAATVDAFRGWAAVEVRCRCRREARRLRNGGTYHTRRETGQRAVVVGGLKKARDMIDPRSLDTDDENA